MKRVRVTSLSLILTICSVVSAAPNHQSTVKDVVMVEDIVGGGPGGNSDSNVALITLSESKSSDESSSSNSKEDNVSDDLIFLTHKSPTATPSQLHTDASASEEHDEDEEDEEEDEEDVASTMLASTNPVTPIDMRPFMDLVPSNQVHTIVSNYFNQDAEVQRAYRYFNSVPFTEQKQQLMQLPEVLAFTRYLNASGLDVLQLAKTLWQAIGPPSTDLPKQKENSTSVCHEIVLKEMNPETNSTGEPVYVKGLQGMVDNVLNSLPQDQILATFFDKIESDQKFSKLVDSIGTPKFSKILSNLQNSGPLRFQLVELQNCGINISQIVESLKSYFFLSSF